MPKPPPPSPTAPRPLVAALAILLFAALPALSREFDVRSLSEPGRDARMPSIGHTGVVAWHGSSIPAGDAPMSARPDVLRAPPNSRRIDVYVWRDGQIRNVTAEDPRIPRRSEKAFVHGDDVLFTAYFGDGVPGGYPLELATPQKSDSMAAMESEYPTLFDPPLPAPVSALEAQAAADAAANAAEQPAPETPPPPPDDAKDSSLQYQMWRTSGKGGDVAVYRANGLIERITPGNRHYGMPVMSDAGIAFQVARGWPYGYEMAVWKPGDTELTQITANYFYVLNPAIHGNDLVFQGWDGNDFEIFHYRFDTAQLEQLTNNQFDDTDPDVWDGEFAWVAHPTVEAEIFHMRDGVIRKISEGSTQNAVPSIWQGRVVWQGHDETDLEIYYFNGRRTIKLTSNVWDDVAPHMRDGLIAWMSYVANGTSQIMALDLGDNVSVQLTENDWENSFPRTAGEKIVWQTLAPEGASVMIAEPVAPRTAPID
jgi:hypothetical protein